MLYFRARALLLGLALFLAPTLVAMSQSAVNLNEKSCQSFQADYSIKRPVILWDFHGVMASRYTGGRLIEACKMYWESPWMFGSFEEAYETTKLLLKIVLKEPSSEEFIQLARKYNNECIENLVIKATNRELTPISGVLGIIKSLSEKGYINHMGSNIGGIAFDALVQNADNEYPLFEDAFNKYFLARECWQLCEEKEGRLKKPDRAFFDAYLKKTGYNLDNQKVILIDDKEENIAIAKEIGFDAIHFKDADQLKQELKCRGIDL